MEALRKALRVSLVVLFGSYAKNNYTVKSDVDLLVVHKDESKDAYAKVKKTLNIRGIEPHVYSEEEYSRMKDTVERMTAGGVIIFRDESFPS